jgi:hypothetical protein
MQITAAHILAGLHADCNLGLHALGMHGGLHVESVWYHNGQTKALKVLLTVRLMLMYPKKQVRNQVAPGGTCSFVCGLRSEWRHTRMACWGSAKMQMADISLADALISRAYFVSAACPQPYAGRFVLRWICMRNRRWCLIPFC